MSDSPGASGARDEPLSTPQVDSARLIDATTSIIRSGLVLRTCLGCRRRDDQAHLIRVVAGNGALVVDAKGTLPGRGAYVHRTQECVTASVHRKAWGRALKVSAPLADAHLWQALAEVPHPKGERA